jgi:hypothetical protein
MPWVCICGQRNIIDGLPCLACDRLPRREKHSRRFDFTTGGSRFRYEPEDLADETPVESPAGDVSSAGHRFRYRDESDDLAPQVATHAVARSVEPSGMQPAPASPAGVPLAPVSFAPKAPAVETPVAPSVPQAPVQVAPVVAEPEVPMEAPAAPVEAERQTTDFVGPSINGVPVARQPEQRDDSVESGQNVAIDELAIDESVIAEDLEVETTDSMWPAAETVDVETDDVETDDVNDEDENDSESQDEPSELVVEPAEDEFGDAYDSELTLEPSGDESSVSPFGEALSWYDFEFDEQDVTGPLVGQRSAQSSDEQASALNNAPLLLEDVVAVASAPVSDVDAEIGADEDDLSFGEMTWASPELDDEASTLGDAPNSVLLSPDDELATGENSEKAADALASVPVEESWLTEELPAVNVEDDDDADDPWALWADDLNKEDETVSSSDEDLFGTPVAGDEPSLVTDSLPFAHDDDDPWAIWNKAIDDDATWPMLDPGDADVSDRRDAESQASGRSEGDTATEAPVDEFGERRRGDPWEELRGTIEGIENSEGDLALDSLSTQSASAPFDFDDWRDVDVEGEVDGLAAPAVAEAPYEASPDEDPFVWGDEADEAEGTADSDLEVASEPEITSEPQAVSEAKPEVDEVSEVATEPDAGETLDWGDWSDFANVMNDDSRIKGPSMSAAIPNPPTVESWDELPSVDDDFDWSPVEDLDVPELSTPQLPVEDHPLDDHAAPEESAAEDDEADWDESTYDGWTLDENGEWVEVPTGPEQESSDEADYFEAGSASDELSHDAGHFGNADFDDEDDALHYQGQHGAFAPDEQDDYDDEYGSSVEESEYDQPQYKASQSELVDSEDDEWSDEGWSGDDWSVDEFSQEGNAVDAATAFEPQTDGDTPWWADNSAFGDVGSEVLTTGGHAAGRAYSGYDDVDNDFKAASADLPYDDEMFVDADLDAPDEFEIDEDEWTLAGEKPQRRPAPRGNDGARKRSGSSRGRNDRQRNNRAPQKRGPKNNAPSGDGSGLKLPAIAGNKALTVVVIIAVVVLLSLLFKQAFHGVSAAPNPESTVTASCATDTAETASSPAMLKAALVATPNGWSQVADTASGNGPIDFSGALKSEPELQSAVFNLDDTRFQSGYSRSFRSGSIVANVRVYQFAATTCANDYVNHHSTDQVAQTFDASSIGPVVTGQVTTATDGTNTYVVRAARGDRVEIVSWTGDKSPAHAVSGVLQLSASQWSTLSS